FFLEPFAARRRCAKMSLHARQATGLFILPQYAPTRPTFLRRRCRDAEPRSNKFVPSPMTTPRVRAPEPDNASSLRVFRLDTRHDGCLSTGAKRTRRTHANFVSEGCENVALGGRVHSHARAGGSGSAAGPR